MITMNRIPRRIVTDIKDGKSIIKEDALASNVVEHVKDLYISDIWSTQTTPASLDDEISIPNTAFPITPKNGTLFRYVSIPPDKDLGVEIIPGQPHPMMHQTDTLDYIIILAGELYLIMEDGETLLKPGDIVIQRGTNHAWSNRSDQPVIQLAVLIDASGTH
ncbi:cupin domain-containing protein [Dyadobacter luteus]|uniref:Cupin domain-containing protein n=2 Tax=Dyadobacter luteus TaxID=2259619 RepID=A0A3D8Y6C8_9BACT|nr:cupin domain-containing protein [Dyadobacter luteus]